MTAARTIPLYDVSAHPSSWNERMAPGEFAVHYSSFNHSISTPVCTIFASHAAAIVYAQEQVAERPQLRCRIYDHNGLVGPPLDEIKGAAFKGDSEISPRFRRWAGSILFFGGLILTAIDWHSDFSLTWPALIGTRMIFPGLILLFIEAMILLTARQKASRLHAAAYLRPGE